jgi:hypothetical protein
VLICAPLDRLDADVAEMQDAMREASRIVLNGIELGADASVVRYPERYMDERGTTMLKQVMALLDRVESGHDVPLPATERCPGDNTPPPSHMGATQGRERPDE